MPWSTVMSTHSWVKSSATVRHFRRRPLASASLTKSMLHTRVGRRRRRQRLALARRPADLLATHGQVRLAIPAVDLLVVHNRVLRTQQVVQAAIAEPAARL